MSDGPSEPDASGVSVAFEYVDVELLGVDAEVGTVPPLITECIVILIACAVDTAKTRLVITGDFVRSVKDRSEPGSTHHENYDTQRNTGMVAGKTIKRSDSTVDILLHAAFFAPGEDGDDPFAETRMRTLVHEAQHVVIYQHGEAGSTFEGEPWARRNFLICADQVIEEYRAESVACRVAGTSGWNTPALTETVTAWFKVLQQVAVVEYQQHLDVAKLSYDILQETHTFWKLLAYVVAELCVTGELLDEVVVDDDLWALTIEPHWAKFVALLSAVPDSMQRAPRAELDQMAAELADLMQSWLPTFGLSFRDGPSEAEFRIFNWTLLMADLD